MKNRYLSLACLSFFISLLTCMPTNFSYAFAYIFAGEANGVDIITHPIGYTGSGGDLTVTIGIDPTSVNAGLMVGSVINVVNTFNALTPTTGNLIFGGSNNIGATEVDFESTLLHEMGHSLGLAHVNAATESGLASAFFNYTKATDGVDNVFNLDDGVDNIIGSDDDVRGDDLPLNYFRMSNNDPFTLAGTVDETTYSRDLADLPGGDLYSVNPDRTVGADLGYANTEAAMQQGAFFDEDQRTLGHDDVAGIMYAEAGLDEIAGTADDYNLILSYAGLTTSADIVIDFDDAQTGFAVSQSSGGFLSGHVVVTGNNIYFNSTTNWFFNTVLPVEWAHFAVQSEGKDAMVHWATSKEVNVDYFEVQRQNHQGNWEPLTAIKGKYNARTGSDYQYRDRGAAQYGNTLSYRIRQVDVDGQSNYSEIREVIFQRESAEVITFGPIPVRPFSYVALYLTQTEPIKFAVRDMAGRVVKSWVSFQHRGYNEVQVGDQILMLPQAAYLLDISSPSLRRTYKFIR